jgi:hypothetical protein
MMSEAATGAIAAVASALEKYILQPLFGCSEGADSAALTAEEYFAELGVGINHFTIRIHSGHGGDSAPVNNASLVDYRHCKQLYSWDCGLACICMVVKHCQQGRSRHAHPRVTSVCVDQLKEGFTEYLRLKSPLWTIDIYCLLGELNHLFNLSLDLEMFTLCAGCPTAHKDLEWYTDGIDEDTARIGRKLIKAKVICCYNALASITVCASVVEVRFENK